MTLVQQFSKNQLFKKKSHLNTLLCDLDESKGHDIGSTYKHDKAVTVYAS